MYATHSSDRNFTATTMAQSKIEEMLNTAYDSLGSGSDSTDGLTRVWSVTNNLSNEKIINVTVSWIDTRGRTNQVALNSIQFDPSYTLSMFNFSEVFSGGQS